MLKILAKLNFDVVEFIYEIAINGLVAVKLKCKLSYYGCVYFEPMHPASPYQSSIRFLKQNGALCKLCKDVDIVMKKVPHDLLDFSDNEDGQELDNCSDSIKEINNPLQLYSLHSQQTVFIPHAIIL